MAFSGFTRMLNEKRLSACHRSELCKLVSLIFIRQCVSCRFSIAVICKWGSTAYANETAAYETGNSCKWTLQKSLWSWCNPSLVSTIFLQASFREDEDERGVGGWGGGSGPCWERELIGSASFRPVANDETVKWPFFAHLAAISWPSTKQQLLVTRRLLFLFIGWRFVSIISTIIPNFVAARCLTRGKATTAIVAPLTATNQSIQMASLIDSNLHDIMKKIELPVPMQRLQRPIIKFNRPQSSRFPYASISINSRVDYNELLMNDGKSKHQINNPHLKKKKKK